MLKLYYLLVTEGQKTTVSSEVLSNNVRLLQHWATRFAPFWAQNLAKNLPLYLLEKIACSLLFLSWEQLPPLRMKYHNNQPLIYYLPLNNLSKMYRQPLQEAEGKSTSFFAFWWVTALLERQKNKYLISMLSSRVQTLQKPLSNISSSALTACSNLEFA